MFVLNSAIWFSFKVPDLQSIICNLLRFFPTSAESASTFFHSSPYNSLVQVRCQPKFADDFVFDLSGQLL